MLEACTGAVLSGALVGDMTLGLRFRWCLVLGLCVVAIDGRLA